nr:translation initiation factor IF-2-like [Aegilops tauschii subsp. strangulata]
MSLVPCQSSLRTGGSCLLATIATVARILLTLVTESTRPQNLPHGRASRPRRRPWPRSPASWPFLAASAPLPGLRVPPAPGRGLLRPATPRLAPSPSDRVGRLAPRPRSRARPHRRTCALRAAPQTTASALRRAPAPGRPAARPPAQGRCPAAPRSRAQPRPPGFVPVAFAEHADANAGWSKLAERLYGRTMAAIDRRAGT